MSFRHPGGPIPVIFTVDAGSATTSATISTYTDLDAFDYCHVHNFGATNIYARVSLDGTNYTVGNVLPTFRKFTSDAGASSNTVLSANEIGELHGPFKSLTLMSLTAGSARAAVSFR